MQLDQIHWSVETTNVILLSSISYQVMSTKVTGMDGIGVVVYSTELDFDSS
jgi:hypothetical protein